MIEFEQLLLPCIERLHASPPKGTNETQIEILSKKFLTLETTFSQLIEEILRIVAELTEQQTKLIQNESLRKIQNIKQLCNLIFKKRHISSQLKTNQKELDITNKVIDKIKIFSNKIDNAEDELNSFILNKIESEVKVTFQKITNQTKLIPKIRVNTERKIRKAEILIEDFYGLGEVNARDYLSEAYRNSLGLSIYFASLLTKKDKFNTFILDDITHSTDHIHRRDLSKYLINNLRNSFQLLIFTHDDQWYERLQNDLTVNFIGMKATNWDINGAVIGMEKWRSLIDKARDKITIADKSGGNQLRMALEQFMDEMCEELRIKMPYKKDVIKITFEDKKKYLISTIKEKWQRSNGLINPDSHDFTRLSSSQKISNLVSHWGTMENVSLQTLEDTLLDAEDFFNLFKCKNILNNGNMCNTPIKNLEKVNNANPICKGCNQNITL